MIFVGSEKEGYLVAEIADELHLKMEYVAESSYIENQVNKIMNSDTDDYVIYDISQYINEDVKIAEQIHRIHKAKKAKPIIYAPGYLPRSKVIKALYSQGITNYVFSIVPGQIKDDLEKCINGYYDVNPIEGLVSVSEELEQQESNKSTIRSVALVGACERIGTTTQAIQVVKYLQLMGYKTCYIEMNNTEYIKLIKEYYDGVKIDDELEKITYMNVDMYFNPNRINEYLDLGYDFYVYDYGVINSIDFNRVSFLEKNIRIIVGGIKANEIESINNVFMSDFYKNVLHIFSFIPENEQKDVYELMEEKADCTFFAEYAPDMFTLKKYSMYHKMLNVEEKSENKNSKKSFFSKFKGKGK